MIRNAVVQSICAGDTSFMPASYAEIQEAMPAKEAPTSLGTAALTPAPKEQLSDEELKDFLEMHQLGFCKDMEGIAWRAHKVKYALEKNQKLINPSLTTEQ